MMHCATFALQKKILSSKLGLSILEGSSLIPLMPKTTLENCMGVVHTGNTMQQLGTSGKPWAGV